MVHGLAVDGDAGRCRRVDAEHQAGDFGAARAEKARDADDLAFVDGADRRGPWPLRPMPWNRDPAPRLLAASGQGSGVVVEGDVLAQHHADDIGGVQGVQRLGSPTSLPLRRMVTRSARSKT